MEIFHFQTIVFVFSCLVGRHFETYFARACSELYNNSSWAPPFWAGFCRLCMLLVQIEAKQPQSAFMQYAEYVREA